jgi:hypothetical protein
MAPSEHKPAVVHTVASLDRSIALAEQRLIEREQRLRLRWQGITRRARRAVEPRRLGVPALGVAFSLVATWWSWRQASRAMRATRRAATASAAPEAPTHRWADKALMLWSLLPHDWRALLTLELRTLIVGAAMPLIERLVRKKKS